MIHARPYMIHARPYMIHVRPYMIHARPYMIHARPYMIHTVTAERYEQRRKQMSTNTLKNILAVLCR